MTEDSRLPGIVMWLVILAVTGWACSSGQEAGMSATSSPGSGPSSPPVPVTPTSVPATTTTPAGSEDPKASATTTTAGGAVPEDSIVRLPPGSERASVVEVIDGDTMSVFVDGGEARVRLIGINAPEGGECFAAEASRALTDLVSSGEVYLERDQSEVDRYRRLLRYVWTDDGLLVNAALVEGGFALARDYPPDLSRSSELHEAQDRARTGGAGLWSETACGDASTIALGIAHIEYDAPGDDNQNLNGEWVDIVNDSDSAVGLEGWALKDESASHRYAFPPGFTLSPGAGVRIFTGCGPDSATELYWCESGSAVWNNGGDTGFLLDPAGNIVDSLSYSP